MTSTGNRSQLEDLTPGVVVVGLRPDGPVTVVAAVWNGSSCVTLTYRTSAGEVAEQLVFRDDETSFAIEAAAQPFSFDGDPDRFRLVSEARRIRLAYLFDPRLAVHLSLLEPLPHQIQAVYGEMLPRQPLRFLLADDPGAGKTIMAGLYIKELMLRGDLRRCLIVAPGGLVTQWQDELADKLGLSFQILTRDLIEASRTADAFSEHDLVIARLDHLSRNEELVEQLRHTEWDLVVVDEAHRMSAHFYGNELKETKRYQLGQVLGHAARHFLLMTATPHAGKEEDYQLFLALLDADRFEGRIRDGGNVDASDLMRRMIKERLLRFDGRPLFPERRAYTLPYPLSELESELYDEVTTYVTEQMNRADALSKQGEGRRGNRVGFALTVLQRRLASSPEAIYKSLARRRQRLEDRVAEERQDAVQDVGADVDFDELEDLDEAEVERLEDEVVDEASSARTIAELQAEIATLQRLETLAARVRSSGTDRKWQELAGLLSDSPELFEPSGARRKLIVFTEHRDTLNYLVERLRTFLAREEAVISIHGGTPREERRRLQELFMQDRDTTILVATDAAGEGINLQRAHLLVNYDLPWNPNRIEQRFGRVHRIGQEQVCHMWNLVSTDTREGQVYVRLLTKLEEQRRALGGQVFNVLGDALPGRVLRDLMIEAIRYGDREDVRARLNAVVDDRVGDGVVELIERQALAADVLGPADVERIRRDMLEAEARRLQPHYVRSWFAAAFELTGGRMLERETGRFEIVRVPGHVRERGRILPGRVPVLSRYERVTFDKGRARVDGKPPAELLAPGHPLLEAVLDLTIERDGGVLRQGALLVDEDPSAEPRILLYLEHAITDARESKAGRHVVSRRFEFVEVLADGTARPAGPAPYLDLRPLLDAEVGAAADLLAGWPLARADVERVGLEHAVGVAVPEHLAEVRAKVVTRVAKVRAAVHERLSKEIEYWDHRANVLSEQAAAGKQPRMNPDRARARANDLAARLEARMGELDREHQLQALPPLVVGAALILPVASVAGSVDGVGPPVHARNTKEVELRAVDAVVAAEEALGREVEVMPPNNPGFDLRSTAENGRVWFIEVKGRLSGAATFTVTRNEILHALNIPAAYLLAMVEVSPDGAASDSMRYLRRPFGDAVSLPFATTSANLDWDEYWQRGGAPS
ncbi:MAG: SNF2-related protein [Actinomycetota bacterium]|nr:SNF2-related protein [Actinomycetota bacterium]